MATVEQERWSEGPVLNDLQLAEAVRAHAKAVATIAGDDDEPELPLDTHSASELLGDASAILLDVLEQRGDDLAAAATLVIENTRLGTQVADAAVEWRARAYASVQAALGRLRGATTVRQLMTLGPAELCKCGFDRAMLSRVDGSIGVPESFYWTGDPESAKAMVRVGQEHPIQLNHNTLETEMIRRRGPMLVTDPQNDPRAHKPVAEATGTLRYVAAPIMPEGRVIGLLHADCHVNHRLVNEFDRDLLWMFAEGFGYAYERTVLLEKLRSLRQEVRRGNQSILAVMDEFCEADVEVARVDRENQNVAHSAASMFMTAESRLESLLTRRELDVIRLMAAGETNAGIAIKLVVSEGTVKSHVKHILRKLRASNRAEAVSRFIRLSQQPVPIEELDDR